jgi:hypothetical protein
MPFCFPNMCGGGSGTSLVTVLAVMFFGLLLLLNGGGLGGGLFGGANGAGAAAAATADLVGQRATAEKVSSIGTGVDAVAGLATANGVKIEATKDLTAAGFAGVQRDMCAAFANSATLANSNHSDLTRQNTDLRFQLSQCCCDNKAMTAETQRQLADGFCRLSHQYEAGNAAVLRAIADLGCSIERKLDQQRMAELEAKNAKLEGQLSQQNQTATLAAMIQGNRGGCGSCNPGVYYGCGACGPCSPCAQLSEAIIQKGINGIVNPTTPGTGS